MNDLYLIIVIAFVLVGACFAFITAHSIWFTGKIMRGMAEAQFNATMRAAKMQQAGLDKINGRSTGA